MAFFNYNAKLIITLLCIATKEGSLRAGNTTWFSLKNLFPIFR